MAFLFLPVQTTTSPTVQALAEALKTIAASDALWRGFVTDLVQVTSGLAPLPSELEFMVAALQARIGLGERSVARLWLEEKSSFSFLSTCLEALKPLRAVAGCDCAELARYVCVPQARPCQRSSSMPRTPCRASLCRTDSSARGFAYRRRRELLVADDAAYVGDLGAPGAMTSVSVARAVRGDVGAVENLVIALDCCAVLLLHHAMTQDRCARQCGDVLDVGVLRCLESVCHLTMFFPLFPLQEWTWQRQLGSWCSGSGVPVMDPYLAPDNPDNPPPPLLLNLSDHGAVRFRVCGVLCVGTLQRPT